MSALTVIYGMFLLGTCAIIYIARLLFFWIGVQRRGRYRVQNTMAMPMVSVIVPARNEEDKIEACVVALVKSDYPTDKLQIVVVNDRSTDATETILNRLASTYPTLTVIHRKPSDVHQNLQGKPGALHHAITESSGDIILMTDADCIAHPQWVRMMAAACSEADTAMVCGFTSVASTSFLDSVQDVEWTYSQSMARGGISNGIALGCFGNNLGIRRSVYDALGGYASISFSITEDLALMQAVHTKGLGIHYLCEPEATVQTLPCTSIMEYIRQRHRWARGGMALGGAATTFVVASLALWIGLVASAITGHWIWFAAFVAMRLVGDGSMLTYVLVRLRRGFRVLDVIPSLTLLLCTELSLPFLVMRSKVVWKGQIFK